LKRFSEELVQRLIAVVVAVIAFALIPPSLFAQEKVQIYVGGSYMLPPVSVQEQVSYCPVEGTCTLPGTIYTNREGLKGWELSAFRHFSPSLSFVIDATGNYGLGTSGFPRNARVRQHSFLGGLQYQRQGHFSPFVHALFGATYQQVTASGNTFFVTFPSDQWGFAGAAGGGVDIKLSTSFSIRLIQADYLVTRLANTIQSQPRVSAGLIFRY
jgi:opacity protein-like surface antigen